MTWRDYDNEAATGNFVKLNIGDSAIVQVHELTRFYDKTWESGKTERMVEFSVTDLGDIEAGPKTLDVGVRRGAPLNALRKELAGKGIDLSSRAIEIRCDSISHPTRPGQRIGVWTCSDKGPATAHGGAAVEGFGADAPVDEGLALAIGAIADASTVEDLRNVFGLAWQDCTNDAKRAELKAAYDARKAELASKGAPIPF